MPRYSKQQIASLSISEIAKRVEDVDYDVAFIDVLQSDTRSGVRAIGQKLIKQKQRLERQQKRQIELCAIENELRASGKKIIAGVDEAGRGPLAGPVVAAAVILPENAQLPGCDDSKKIPANRREKLFEQIISIATAWGIGMVDNEEIDNTSILNAAMKAMRIAVRNTKLTPDIALVDGNRSPGFVCEERLITDGDARCRSIAAASILAKVTRDRIMVELDSIYPYYGFAGHKGYGSRAHVEALRKYGPCDIHRISFKIVPAVSPQGTTVSVLKKRLLNAPTRSSFNRVVSGITHIKPHLDERDIESLRDVYRVCNKRFMYEV